MNRDFEHYLGADHLQFVRASTLREHTLMKQKRDDWPDHPWSMGIEPDDPTISAFVHDLQAEAAVSKRLLMLPQFLYLHLGDMS